MQANTKIALCVLCAAYAVCATPLPEHSYVQEHSSSGDPFTPGPITSNAREQTVEVDPFMKTAPQVDDDHQEITNKAAPPTYSTAATPTSPGVYPTDNDRTPDAVLSEPEETQKMYPTPFTSDDEAFLDTALATALQSAHQRGKQGEDINDDARRSSRELDAEAKNDAKEKLAIARQLEQRKLKIAKTLKKAIEFNKQTAAEYLDVLKVATEKRAQADKHSTEKVAMAKNAVHDAEELFRKAKDKQSYTSKVLVEGTANLAKVQETLRSAHQAVTQAEEEVETQQNEVEKRAKAKNDAASYLQLQSAKLTGLKASLKSAETRKETLTRSWIKLIKSLEKKRRHWEDMRSEMSQLREKLSSLQTES